MKPGLERIERLLLAMGNPHSQLPCVHIAGTNGKGTTAQIISTLFTQAGYKVGRFTSPHLHSYTERFTINGLPIAGEELLNYLDQTEAHIEKMLAEGYDHPTEFEILTAIAFLYFRDKKVDLAVIEVGMGGLYDSTNVITPLVSVITSIGLDHVAFLGNTLKEVAGNKAGIIKANVPVVIGDLPGEAQAVITETAQQKSARIYFSRSVSLHVAAESVFDGYRVDIATPRFHLNYVHYSLVGQYQLKNLATALTAAEQLLEKGYPFTAADVLKTLAVLKMPGRMEVLQSDPLVIADVAHNAQGAEALSQALRKLLPAKKKILLCAILDDKDREAILTPLGSGTDLCIVTRPEGHRNKKWREAAYAWSKIYPETDLIIEENISRAVAAALQYARQNNLYILITGSFYLMDQARRCFTSN